MKIFFYDYAHHKTTKHWLEYLKANHEVVEDVYFNPIYAEWADVIYMEWCEGAAIEASQGEADYEGVYDHAGIRGVPGAQYSGHFNWKGKPLYIRAIDIDVYYGHFRQVQWDNVTGLLTIAPHIQRKMHDGSVIYPEKLKEAIIPLSVKLEEWNYVDRGRPNKKIAWVNHHWSAKGFMLMLQAFAKLIAVTKDRTWELHVVENGRSTEHWLFDYIQYMLTKLNIKDRVFFYGPVDSVDKFLDDKDYIVSSSMKEAFSLILAEGMAKGMKALTHSWWGADEIWPDEMIWATIDEFPDKLLKPKFDSKHYRELAAEHSHDKEIIALKDFCGL